MIQIDSRMMQKHDTKQNWVAINPVLLKAEFGIEIDTGKMKIGDGFHAWNELDYFAECGAPKKSIEIIDDVTGQIYSLMISDKRLLITPYDESPVYQTIDLQDALTGTVYTLGIFDGRITLTDTGNIK